MSPRSSASKGPLVLSGEQPVAFLTCLKDLPLIKKGKTSPFMEVNPKRTPGSDSHPGSRWSPYQRAGQSRGGWGEVGAPLDRVSAPAFQGTQGCAFLVLLPRRCQVLQGPRPQPRPLAWPREAHLPAVLSLHICTATPTWVGTEDSCTLRPRLAPAGTRPSHHPHRGHHSPGPAGFGACPSCG